MGALERLRCEHWREGAVAQILHEGRYEDEAPTVKRLHEGIAEAGLEMRGCHHEIYVSDPNRTAPDRLKTVIRQPVHDRSGPRNSGPADGDDLHWRR